MRTTKANIASVAMLLLGAGATFGGEDDKTSASGRESELLAVLKSSASEKDKRRRLPGARAHRHEGIGGSPGSAPGR